MKKIYHMVISSEDSDYTRAMIERIIQENNFEDGIRGADIEIF